MFARLAIACALILATRGFAVAADAQHSCEPWPNCQLDSLVIKPGAPNTGLRPQGVRPNAPDPDEDRGSLRLPKSPSDNKK
jgi:hypothetical protein